MKRGHPAFPCDAIRSPEGANRDPWEQGRLVGHTSRCALLLGAAAMTAALWESASGASFLRECPIDSGVLASTYLQAQPWNPTAEDLGYLPADVATPAQEELEGAWSGSATATSVSSPVPQVRAEYEKRLNVPTPNNADVVSQGAGSLLFTFHSQIGEHPVQMRYDSGQLTGTSSLYGVGYQFRGTVSRAGDGLRISGTVHYAESRGLVTGDGTWTLSKRAEEVTIALTYPVGRSEKVFRTGWVFGAQCVYHRGKPDEQDISKEVEWTGSGTFEPGTGDRSRPTFGGTGANKIKLKCREVTKEYPVEVTSRTTFVGVLDLGTAPADAHGCPGCPHPVVGPIISGSPDVLIDGSPAARVGDMGVHAACCGPNLFTIAAGDEEVLINGRRAAYAGSRTNHCGGVGWLVKGRIADNAGRASKGKATDGGGAAPVVDGTVPDAAGAVTVTTGSKEKKALQFGGGGGKTQPAVATIFPNSKAERTTKQELDLTEGGAIVTSPASGAGVNLVTPAGTVTLHSQAVVRVADDRVELLLLTGSASVQTRKGGTLSLSAGQRVTFTSKGQEEAPRAYTVKELTAAVAPLSGFDAGSTTTASPGKLHSLVYVGIAGVVGLVLLLIAAAAGVVVLLVLRARRPSRGGVSR